MRFLHLWEDGAPNSSEFAERLRSWIHDASNPFADWYFGDREAAGEIIGEWMERPSSELYLGRAIVMMDDQEEPVGVLLGMSGAEVAACRMTDFTAFCEEIGSETEADEVVDQVVTASRELFPPIEEDAFYISRIAIDPEKRGRGLGRQLVQHTIDLKRRQGFERVRLDVSADNADAIRAYESLGFKVMSQSQSTIAPLEYCAMLLEGIDRADT
ncbi:MAG: GNAT family N-acetyltransferase [Myxococcales bacterium]|nr:GNAT family N-acetyltransferase [Myxococcales bacterium]MDH3484849.1 GNAT family N-acetyltransferase [Myxococcales bacterium]